jgi:histidinol-phosphate aminotransferase
VTELAALLRPELADLAAYVPADPPGIDVRLDANESPPPRSPHVREAVVRAVEALALERYPDARATRLRAQIAARTGAKPEELLIGTGSDEVISLLATALARPREGSPQPVVLTPTPTFVMYRVTARAHGWKPVEVSLDKVWDLDAGQMERAIVMLRPSIVYVASPNNPTGNAMSPDRLEKILAAAPDALVVIDEAYAEFAGETRRGWRARYPNLGILKTLSKVGLAALRVGWLEADAELVREIDKARQPFNVSATSQAAAAAVLEGAWGAVLEHVADVVRERARVAAEIAKTPGFEVTPSAANFVWVRTPRPAAEVVDLLKSRGILIRSFHASGGRLANQVRITIGTPSENDRLLEGLAACA